MASSSIIMGFTIPISTPRCLQSSRVRRKRGAFRIVEFPESQDQLYSAGESCFRAPEGVEPVDALTPLVKQGYQEASNVKLIDELVNMIAVSRMYESNVKLLSGVQEASSSLMSVAMG